MSTLSITLQNSGKPLAGANVTYSGNGINNTKQTDANGIATVSGLPNGSYAITGSLNGYTATTTNVITTDADQSVTIELPASPTAAAENAANAVLVNGSADWKTVKAAAEAAVNQLNTGVSSSNLTDNTVVSGLYAQVTTVIQQAVTSVDSYKSQLMISRHSKGFWECVLIDAKLVGITLFQRWVSSEISTIQKKLESKLANI
jgi:hypothetical protein